MRKMKYFLLLLMAAALTITQYSCSKKKDPKIDDQSTKGHFNSLTVDGENLKAAETKMEANYVHYGAGVYNLSIGLQHANANFIIVIPVRSLDPGEYPFNTPGQDGVAAYAFLDNPSVSWAAPMPNLTPESAGGTGKLKIISSDLSKRTLKVDIDFNLYSIANDSFKKIKGEGLTFPLTSPTM